MWPAAAWMGWPGPGTQMPAPRPCRRDLVVARALHPTFTDRLARDLVAPLSRRDLKRVWRATTDLLADPRRSAHDKLNLVILREQVLDRLDGLDAPR